MIDTVEDYIQLTVDCALTCRLLEHNAQAFKCKVLRNGFKWVTLSRI